MKKNEKYLQRQLNYHTVNMSCNICCENLNRSTRSKVVCNSCDFEACKSCVSRFLLGSNEDARCMNCNVGLSWEFMYNSLSSSFVNSTYSKHRGAVLVERQQALLAETMPLAKHTKLIRDYDALLEPMYKERLDIEKQYRVLQGKKKEEGYLFGADIADIANYRAKIKVLTSQIRDVRRKRDLATNELFYMRYGVERGFNPTENVEKPKPPPKYTRACGADECRGFVSTTMECSLCETKYCKECHEVLSDNHVCKDDDIKTTKMIMKDSKNCPNCHVVTYRVSGCPQMWCTMCHSVWDWKTGLIDSGNGVHNPHYFEYLSKMGKDPVTNQPNIGYGNECRILPRVNRAIENLKFEVKPEFVFNMIQLRNHVSAVEIRKYNDFENEDNNNKDLRVRYLLNDIDEECFRRTLYHREKMRLKNREYTQVLRMLKDVLMDLLQRFIVSKTQEEALSIEAEATELINFTNASVVTICKMFKCKHPGIKL